jgi:tRNA threonylcarbamoyladenosine biosynthesis protein TsaB
MILLIDTSTPICRLTLVIGSEQFDYEWEAGRTLAKGILGFIDEKLKMHEASWESLTGLGVFKGPGSFTGLRIGITVMNTLAQSLEIPIVGEVGEAWKHQAIARVNAGNNDQIVVPEYGGEAHITSPKK